MFSSSPLSSYLGIGTYEIKDSKLTMNTYDGQYVYFFDAHSSSKMMGLSEITHGSVFKYEEN